MKEQIIKYIENHPFCTIGQICGSYDGKKRDLMEMLNHLVEEGDVCFENGEYVLPEVLGVAKATIVSVKDHFAFANICETDEDVHINDYDMNSALLGDIVYLHAGEEFKVVRIIKRHYSEIIGEVFKSGKKNYLKVNGIACGNTDFILNDDAEVEEGDVVSSSIEDYYPDVIKCHLIKVLGQKNAPFMDVTRLIMEHDAPIDFPSEVEEQVLSIPTSVSEEEMKGRLDLRKEFIVTIDGDDSRDFDDAISLNRTKDGYELGVHIADVSHYVRQGSPLDEEAQNRGTSIYVTDRVVPMLPFALSNGICSLNEGEDRLTLSCFINIDNNGNVINTRLCESVIKSSHRLTYKFVNKVIEKGEVNDLLTEKIMLFHECAQKVHEVKKKNGTLDLSVSEVKIHVDKTGYPIEIEKRIQGEGENLIEDFMILANEAVATTIFKRRLPFMYRIHEEPSSKRLTNFCSFSSRLGYPAHFDPLNVETLELQQHLSRIKEEDKLPVISAVLLRCLAKARYSPSNKGHYGLASKCYTHFTSPIRRYPDLIVHRLLRRYLWEENFTGQTELELNLEYLGEDTSNKERRATSIERDCIDMKGAEYMSNHIGEEYVGFINGMSNQGLFVELPNGLSGCLRFDDMNDYFSIDEHSYQAFGKRSHARFCMGDKVKVIVAKTDKQKGTITLDLVNGIHVSRNKRGNNVKKSKKKVYKRR
ncbi:MAG: ribonuclease R [Bacilli bacterium]|nr:ribonuclease R [Bacilli bacterium]